MNYKSDTRNVIIKTGVTPVLPKPIPIVFLLHSP